MQLKKEMTLANYGDGYDNRDVLLLIFEYIHSDLWRPEKNPTHSGNFYFLFLVDDFSRKVWVKSDAFDKFKTWKTLVENVSDKKIKTLRIHNGLKGLQ